MAINFNEESLNEYHYSEQFKRHLVQFMAIFTGLQVSSGKNDYGPETQYIRVPIRLGSSDRVVDAIISDNTQNKMIRAPILSTSIMGLYKADDLRKGTGQTSRDVQLPRGGSLPTDLKNITKLMPIPYRLNIDLTVFTTNMRHMFEILEQILILFDPTLQLQLSDDYSDWTKISVIKLEDINWNTNTPIGTDRRLMRTDLSFTLPIYLSAPINIRNNVVNKIRLRLDAIAKAADVDKAVSEINNVTPISDELINIDEMDIPSK